MDTPISTRLPGLALLCRARARLCAVPIEHLAETMRPLPVAPFAGAPSFVCGLSLIRGTPTPVVDVGALLGDGEPPRAARFVSVRTGQRHVALAVEGVLGIRELAAESLSELPPLLGDVGRAAVAHIGALDAELLVVLEAARLVPESLWRMLEGGDEE